MRQLHTHPELSFLHQVRQNTEPHDGESSMPPCTLLRQAMCAQSRLHRSIMSDVGMQSIGRKAFYLLATRQATHAGVGTELRLNAYVLQVLLDDSCCERAGLQTQARSLLSINLIHHLREAQLLQPDRNTTESAQPSSSSEDNSWPFRVARLSELRTFPSCAAETLALKHWTHMLMHALLQCGRTTERLTHCKSMTKADLSLVSQVV